MAYVLMVIRLITITRMLPGAGCSICAWVGLLLQNEPCNYSCWLFINVQPPAWVGHSVISVCLFVCRFICTLKQKRLDLSTPKLVHVYSIVVARHALTQRSKGKSSRSHGYESRHGWWWCMLLRGVLLQFDYNGILLNVCCHCDLTLFNVTLQNWK